VASDAPLVVTFDLFSALVDSRTGASEAFDRVADARRWQVGGGAVYDAWDTRNKQAQKACRSWVPYADLARQALASTYDALGLDGDVDEDLDQVLATLPLWPLWPDVAEGLPRLARDHRIGLLSNVDDELFLRTQAAPYVDPDLALTSERLRVYKPDPRIYQRAEEHLGRMVHVATSARDVRGAVEAGIPVVRLRRPGHRLEPDGPSPLFGAADMAELGDLVGRALQVPR
jgi:2-haloalkanoic acid dehalogenase type II